jgi:hypothetical protein
MTAEELTAALVNFPSQEAVPILRPDSAHLRDLAARVRSAFSTPHLDEDFAGRLREGIVAGLSRLDAFPRDDPFWEKTNRRPTISRLRHLLARGQAEEWACWAWAATSLLWCCNDFGLDGWQGLKELGKLDVAWPIQAAFHVWANSGYDPATALVHFLEGNEVVVPARNALEGIATRHGEWSSGWVQAVARRCPVRMDPAWLSWNGGMVRGIARAIHAERAWGQLPVLADALEEAGCTNDAILRHCRQQEGVHAKGCWLVDLLLGKEVTP